MVEAFLRFLNINVPKSDDDLFDEWSKETGEAQLDSTCNDFSVIEHACKAPAQLETRLQLNKVE